MKQYKLLKDLPGLEKGTILRWCAKRVSVEKEATYQEKAHTGND